jgi:hypothetical protein
LYVSTVAGEPARSCTDAHADGSTFVPRKATISRFAGNPTRTLFADALKADGNHRVTFYCPPSLYEVVRAISFNDRQISLYGITVDYVSYKTI